MTTTLADADLNALAVDLDAQSRASAAASTTLASQAADLSVQASKLRASLVQAPPPAVIGFKDRMLLDAAKWKTVMEDEFLTPATEGDFLKLYGARWDSAGNGKQYLTTSKRGEYSPNQLSVVDLPSGERVLQCRLTPAKLAKKTLHQGCSPQIKVNGNPYGMTTGEFIQVRAKVLKPASNWHAANLGWPLKWPQSAEPDFWESGLSSTSKVGANIHVQNGGSNGQGQVSISSAVAVTDWFTAGFERVAGQYFAHYINGKQTKLVKHGDLKSPYDIPKDGLRWTLQLEDAEGATPTEECIVIYDWVSIAVPA